MSYQYHSGKMHSGRFLKIYSSIVSKLGKFGESFGSIVKTNMIYMSANRLQHESVDTL